MNKFIDFFNFNFLKRFDKYLLLNHTLIWNIKLHYILFYSLVVAIFLVLLYPTLSPEKFELVYPLLFLLILLFYILWLYSQKDFIFIKEYSRIKFNINKEFFIYSFSTIAFFIPILVMTILFFNTFDNYLISKELSNHTFDKNTTYKDICDEPNILCTQEGQIKKSLNDIVTYINAKDMEDYKDIKIAKDRISTAFFIINTFMFIVFFIPVQIILARYGGSKNYIFMVIFLIIHFVFFGIIMSSYVMNTVSFFETICLYMFSLFVIFFLFVKYRLIIIFSIIFSIIVIYPFIVSKFDFIQYKLWLFLGILIQFLIFRLITKYLVHLISQPKE